MIDHIKKFECCGCEACSAVCPTQAIRMKQDEEGFFYPQIEKEKCISCEKCEETCPTINHLTNLEKDTFLKAYACRNKNEAIRSQSTSGGIFTAIAEEFLAEKEGIVYGVQFDETFRVMYGSTDRKEEISKFRGSKYVQCRAGRVYKEIENLLKKGKYIFFSGLPCQVEALYRFLNRIYPNLYTMDMVCFGIASPLIWELYLNRFHTRNRLKEVIFKDKITGWKNWSVKVIEGEDTTYFSKYENLYMNSYLQRINIRPSCFHCKFKGLFRNSDFTIADCWGLGEENTRLNDDKGLSAFMIHTRKGYALFENIRKNLWYEEYEPKALMEGNWAVYKVPMENENRSSFFEEIKNKDFKETFQRYFGSEDETSV